MSRKEETESASNSWDNDSRPGGDGTFATYETMLYGFISVDPIRE
jgi:hypothetical protein